MERWSTVDLDTIDPNKGRSDSRQSLDSVRSDLVNPSGSGRRDSSPSSMGRLDFEENKGSHSDSSSQNSLILAGGNQLNGETATELSPSYLKNSTPQFPETSTKLAVSGNSMYGTAKAKAANSPFTAPPIESVPVEPITIPVDGNISAFTCNQLANFLMCLRVEDNIVSHLHRKSVDGHRFARMKNPELESLGMCNPVILFFRNKSSGKVKSKGQKPFIL